MIGGKQKLLFQPLSELSVLNSLPLMFQDCKKQNQAGMLLHFVWKIHTIIPNSYYGSINQEIIIARAC